jgi:hypothetical protein
MSEEPKAKSVNPSELIDQDLDRVTGATVGIVSPRPGGTNLTVENTPIFSEDVAVKADK